MFRSSHPRVKPLPAEFLAWQVSLRKHTMDVRHGSPHAGVAPLVIARRPGTTLEVAGHSIICGLLPRADRIAGKTEEWRKLYESGIGEGARAVYDRGIEQMRSAYASTEDHRADAERIRVAEVVEVPARVAAGVMDTGGLVGERVVDVVLPARDIGREALGVGNVEGGGLLRSECSRQHGGHQHDCANHLQSSFPWFQHERCFHEPTGSSAPKRVSQVAR